MGDVTAQTVSGLGSIQVPLTVSRTFTPALTRGTESVSAQVAVAAIDSIAAVTGPVAGATSLYTTTPSGAAMFYRAKQ